MSSSTKLFKIFINGVSSPELLLWEPMFKKFLIRNKEHLCSFQSPLNDSDSNYARDHLGITNIDAIETIERDTHEELILFFCLAHQIPTSFSAKDDQDACCFFGGMSSSNLSEQLESARKRKITTIYSDLLPCEVKDSLPLEEFLFFNKVQAFLPHGHDETTIKINSNSKTKVLFITDKAPKSKTNASTSKILLNVLSQKEDFQVVELSQTDLNQWIKNISPGENCQKIILSNIPIPLQHFVTDICRLRSIQLQHIFTESFPSPQRRYLNDNELFESLWDAVSSSCSVRKRVHDVLDYGKAEPTTTPKSKDVRLLTYSSPEAIQENGAINTRKLFTDLDGKLESFRKTEQAACKTAFVSSENSLRLKHPYSELDMGEEINALVIHTLVFLEASIRDGSSKSSYAVSPLIMHRCMHHCLFSGKTSPLQVLLSLFRLEPRSFVDAIIYIHQETRDEKRKLLIINQIITTLAVLEIDHDLKVELYDRLRKSAISILLDLFIHLDLNENEEFLALAKESNLGINIIYPLVYYIGTKPRDGGLNFEEIDQIFETELQNADNTKLLVITKISMQLAYQEDTSLEYFEGLDSRFRHLFEKCSKSLFQYAYLSSINGNSLDKRVLNKFNSANAPYDKVLIICASILLGNDQLIADELDSLSEENAKDFLASDLDIRIKLQCLILIRHYLEIGPINDSAILLFKSCDFRHYDLFLKLVEDLPKCQTDMEPDQKSILTKIASACIVHAC
jgi:hypothetical protein